MPTDPVVGSAPVDAATSAATETVQLRIRVMALLDQAPATRLERAREMAAYISPRAGYTAHRSTLRAADEMRSLVDRAGPFRSTPAV